MSDSLSYCFTKFNAIQYHDDGNSKFLIEFFNQLQDFNLIPDIQICGRLIFGTVSLHHLFMWTCSLFSVANAIVGMHVIVIASAIPNVSSFFIVTFVLFFIRSSIRTPPSFVFYLHLSLLLCLFYELISYIWLFYLFL